MATTITFENPLTMLGKALAKRKISKIDKKLAKLQAQKSKLEAKYQDDSQNIVIGDKDGNTHNTTKAVMKISEVEAKFGKKIIFKKNQRNSFYHADKGMIDGKFMEFARSTKWFNVSPLGKQERVFFNHVSNGQKSLATKHAKKNGWEISFA
jgi:predicted PilT family ATPase